MTEKEFYYQGYRDATNGLSPRHPAGPSYRRGYRDGRCMTGQQVRR